MSERFINVWDAVEEAPDEAARMKLLSSLMDSLLSVVSERKLAKLEAAAAFGASPEMIEDLLQERIDRFSLDQLVRMLGHAGLDLEVRVSKAA